MPPLKIYISSTLKDLTAERAAVTEALNGCATVHSYTASEDRVIKSCLDDVAKCNIYVGILGLRYGYISPDTTENPKGLSVTHLEFEEAGRLGRPRFLFLKSEASISAA